MNKVFTVNVKNCKECPLLHVTDYDVEYDTGVFCSHKDVKGEGKVMSLTQWFDGKSVKNVHGTNFPAFCPLPNEIDLGTCNTSIGLKVDVKVKVEKQDV